MLGTKETRAVRSKRIQILQEYNVLNLVQDDVLDDILQLAIHICQASHAAIAFVDTDEQWLKAAVGFKIESLPVDITVKALLLKDIQIFHPLHNSLIASNVLLQKFPQYQSGLSLLLKTPNGYPLGYLMVLSAEDKPFTDVQIAMMQVLTRQIMAEVTLKVSQKVHAEMVADLQLLHQELQMAKDLAEASNQRKSRVLAYVSHELKNPLNATVLFGNILKADSSGNLSESQSGYLQNMLEGCQHLKDVMSDLLEIAPVEAGLFKLTINSFSLKDLIPEVVVFMSPSADQKQVELEAVIADTVDCLEGDVRRIRQVLINLISNAIKYTHAGDTVKIEAHSAGKEVRILVQDKGPGIPKDEIQRLFQDYYRVQNQHGSQKEGLGLGLALCKNLVELHHGTIQVESELGKGTTFIVELPLAQP